MAISKSRQFFRHFLLTTLIFSFAFFSTAAYFYVTTKRNPQKLKNIIPVVYSLDILTYNIKAAFADSDEDKFQVALSLYKRRYESSMYLGAAKDLLRPLIDKHHAGALNLYADILTREVGDPYTKTTIASNFKKRAIKIQKENKDYADNSLEILNESQ